jgi:hypothetical protein
VTRHQRLRAERQQRRSRQRRRADFSRQEAPSKQRRESGSGDGNTGCSQTGHRERRRHRRGSGPLHRQPRRQQRRRKMTAVEPAAGTAAAARATATAKATSPPTAATPAGLRTGPQRRRPGNGRAGWTSSGSTSKPPRRAKFGLRVINELRTSRHRG